MGAQLGFAEAFLAAKAGANGRLERIAELLDWAPFSALLQPVGRVSGAGRPPYPALAMFKALLIAQWYQLSDPGLEEALADRISFRRFCGFALDAATPDETTICRFRGALAASGLGERLMAELARQLAGRGFIIKEGTMLDATLVEAQAARPSERGGRARSAVDPDAAFAKKRGTTCFGYKGHVAVDVGSGLVRQALLTPANVNETSIADRLIAGDERAIYADQAYATHARRAALKARAIKDRIMHRPNKHQPRLPAWQARRNRLIAPIRAGVERVFGTLKRSYGYSCVRYFSLAANALEFQLKCFAYNLRRTAKLAAAG